MFVELKFISQTFLLTFYGSCNENFAGNSVKVFVCKFALQTLLLIVLPHCVAEARKNSIRKLKLPHRVFIGVPNENFAGNSVKVFVLKFASQTLLLIVLPHCVAEARKNSIRKLKFPHRVFIGVLTKTLPKIASKF